ncbi:sugar-binding domain protein [Brevibacillus porteri]|uniref:sugar-binding domain protein n=1 Tax=Brevibacillus porteri TaxID=2126350 RepID=UPI003D25877E
MNKKVALSVLSTAVVASMAASAYAAPQAGVYVGGDVKKFYSTTTLLNLTKEAKAQYAKDLRVGSDNLVFVHINGKGAFFSEILNHPNGATGAFAEPLKKSDFVDLYNVVKPDGTSTETEDARAKVEGDNTGELKVESVSAISKTTLKINFNKAVDSVTNENFSIAGVVVNAAKLSEDKKSVTLTVSGLNYETEYTVVAANILVEGKPVTLEGKKFKMPAVTEVYNLELTTDAPNDAILADGADNMIITAKLKDKATGQVDVNADNVVLSFESTYGNFGNKRVVVQDGVASVVLTSEFSKHDLVSKIDVQIIEASGDYKDLIGKVVATKDVHFKLKLDPGTNPVKPVFTGAESNQADRITVTFDKDVTVNDFVQYDEVTKKFKVKEDGTALFKENTEFKITQDEGKTFKKILGLKPTSNPRALEVILANEKTGADTYTFLEDNKVVSVELTQANTQNVTKSFILTDPRKPEATSAVAEGLKKVVVKFSEPVYEAVSQLDAGLLEIADAKFGEFDPATLQDTRDTLTITPKNYLTAGTHSVQLSSIKDFAGVSDDKNISTTQTLDFTVAGDGSLPTAEVTTESAEQFRVTFNKLVQGFDNSLLETRDAAGKRSLRLEILTKGTNGVNEWQDANDSLKVPLEVSHAIDNEYVVELKDDWTKIFDTNSTRLNYYNYQFRLVISKDSLTNPANGLKNAEIVLPLSFSGSKLSTPDTTSPVISGFTQIKKDLFEVKMNEPVKLPGAADNAGETPSQLQGQHVPTPIIEFIGKDKDGTTVTIKGKVGNYTNKNGADTNFEVFPDVDTTKGEKTPQDYVNAGGDRNWTLVVRSISDDVGNTASSLTHNFTLDPDQQAGEVFMLKGQFADGKLYDGVKAYLNGDEEDVIVLDYTADVEFTGTTNNAINSAIYTLDGEALPKGVKLSASDSDTLPGVDIVTITLPDGTLSKTGKNSVITVNKSLKSTKGTKLTGEYQISFKPVDAVNPAVAAKVVNDQIKALPATITLADEAKVKAARDAYNALSDDAKKLVVNYATLEAAEKKIADLKKAEGDAAANLKAAQDAVAALEAAAGADLTVEANLTKAEEAVKAAEVAVAKVVAGADKDVLAAKVTLAKKTVADARAKFDADNASNLKAAQDAVAALETAAAADLKVEANLTTAENALSDAKAKVAKVAAGAEKTALEGKVTAAEKTITDARKAFDDAKALEAAKTALNDAVVAAQAKHDAAAEGNASGQYPAPAKADFQTAINTAKGVHDNAASTKAELDQAKADLEAAETAFEGLKTP